VTNGASLAREGAATRLKSTGKVASGALFFWPAKVDLARAGDGANEWWLELVTEAADFGESEFERGGHVLAGHVAGGEDKLADGVLFESVFFEKIVANAFVRSEQDPAFRAH